MVGFFTMFLLRRRRCYPIGHVVSAFSRTPLSPVLFFQSLMTVPFSSSRDGVDGRRGSASRVRAFFVHLVLFPPRRSPLLFPQTNRRHRGKHVRREACRNSFYG